jgi:two-component system chemotaxis response regulator CheB
MRTILGAIDPRLPLAVIVVQHKSPDYDDWLTALLRQRCALDVVTAVDGATVIAGQVLVVPPARHTVVTSDGRLCVVESDGPPLYRPSGDLLLTSMAVVAAHRSIGVILSGEGHDGAAGATVLRRLGGTVLASDKATSTHFRMPAAAIGRGAVDVVLPASQIAERLQSLIRRSVRQTGTVTPRSAPPSAAGSE